MKLYYAVIWDNLLDKQIDCKNCRSEETAIEVAKEKIIELNKKYNIPNENGRFFIDHIAIIGERI